MRRLCNCGCGRWTSGIWNSHKQHYTEYVHGHNATGKANNKLSVYLKGRKDPEQSEKMMGMNNPNYKDGKRCK